MELATAAELATAGGTLVLAIATFASIREGQRSARLAERSLLAGLRPVLFPTRPDDPDQKVTFADDHRIIVQGARGVIDVEPDNIYFAMSIRNVGSGMGVLDGWCIRPGIEPTEPDHASLDDFRRLSRDLYVPSNDQSFWQGAIRDSNDPLFDAVRDSVEREERQYIELLYGDMEGGQRTISRFTLMPIADGKGWYATLGRHWYLDGSSPR